MSRMAATPEELASSVTQLVTFPDVAFAIDEAISDEQSSAADIGSLILSDPALTAAVLRVANSALYNVAGQVDSIDRAVSLVGMRELRDIVFGIYATETFKGIPNSLISVEDFWKHSLNCAAAAQYIGRVARLRNADSLFTAGLLHDVGQLVMFSQDPQRARQALENSLDSDNDGMLPHLAEKEVFGYDHMQVGAAVARQWNFPDSLVSAIAHHHYPYECDEPSETLLAVHVANSIAVLAELRSRDVNDAPAIDPRAVEALGLPDDYVEQTLDFINARVPELLNSFLD